MEWVVVVIVACCMCLYLSFTTLPLYSLVAQMHPDAKQKALARYIKRKHPDAMELLGLDDPDADSGSDGSSSGGSFSHYKAHDAYAGALKEEEEGEGEGEGVGEGNGAAAASQPVQPSRSTLASSAQQRPSSEQQVRNIYIDFRHEPAP